MEPFKVIYVDPPWDFEVWNRDTGSGRSAAAHYTTQGDSWLANLPVLDLAAKDCVLLMWGVWPKIDDVLALGAAWGFRYKTCFSLWAKLNKRWLSAGPIVNLAMFQNLFFFGMGYWTRANTEPCLLFTRGKPKRLSRSVRQFLATPIREHSRKPDEMYANIERMFGGPYVEIFAR